MAVPSSSRIGPEKSVHQDSVDAAAMEVDGDQPAEEQPAPQLDKMVESKNHCSVSVRLCMRD